jgi:riboflavin biosynthesis pyrimidine reductase
VEVERTSGALSVDYLLSHLRSECEVRAVLCEGGPHLLGQLVAADAVDDLFLTTTPVMVGGDQAPRVLEGALTEHPRFELAELLEADGELFARYRPGDGPAPSG